MRSSLEPGRRAQPFPGMWAYALPVMALAAGALFFVYYLYINVTSLSASLTQVVMPGTAQIHLPKAHDYTVFHEYRSVVDGVRYATRKSPAELECAIASLSGAQVALRKPSGSSRYSIMDRAGVSIFTFTITQPGEYEVSCRWKDASPEPQTVIAIGHGFGWDLFTTVLGALAILGAAMVFPVLLFVIIYLRRKKTGEPGGGDGPRGPYDRPSPIEPR